MLGKIDRFFVDIGRDLTIAGRYSQARRENTNRDPKHLQEEGIIQTVRVHSIVYRLSGAMCVGVSAAAFVSGICSSKGGGASLLLSAISGIWAHDLIRIGLNTRSVIAWTQPGQGIGEFAKNACNAGKIGFYTLIYPEENPLVRGTWLVGPLSELFGLNG